MCRFASLLFHVPSLDFAVSNLLSHSKTFEALDLSEKQGWREAHYLPSGEIGCRTIDGDSVSPETAAVVLREQFPTFPGFLSWALSHGASLEDREKEGGCTVAHAAAGYGHLPSGFDRWELVDKYGWTVAHEAARCGHLPSGFDRWELADIDGWTVAHEAAYGGHLPSGFDRWELADIDGWTVAHEAARYGHLPSGFDRWELADERGWTVAHTAACCGHLPSGFDRWELANRNGWTVAHAADCCGRLPYGETVESLLGKRKDGK